MNLNPDFCGARVVLLHLSYQVNWKLVVMWVYDNPLDKG